MNRGLYPLPHQKCGFHFSKCIINRLIWRLITKVPFCGFQMLLLEYSLHLHSLTHIQCFWSRIGNLWLTVNSHSVAWRVTASVYSHAGSFLDNRPYMTLQTERNLTTSAKDLGFNFHHRVCRNFPPLQKSLSDSPSLVPHCLNVFYSVFPFGPWPWFHGGFDMFQEDLWGKLRRVWII